MAAMLAVNFAAMCVGGKPSERPQDANTASRELRDREPECLARRVAFRSTRRVRHVGDK
jgi:hypothetical protein